MKILFVIPARGGSKGIIDKNIKALAGKPLLHYSINFARKFVSDADICLSTDEDKIIQCAAEIGLEIPFIRPAALAQDTAPTFEVLQHALNFYKNKNIDYQAVILLQPTSPFRKESYLRAALQAFDADTDMVVSVKEAKSNPYFTLFEENEAGYLHISKGDGRYQTRQSAPAVYEYNGSLYVINPKALLEYDKMSAFAKIKKIVMPAELSIDLDTLADWEYAEYAHQKLNFD